MTRQLSLIATYDPLIGPCQQLGIYLNPISLQNIPKSKYLAQVAAPNTLLQRGTVPSAPESLSVAYWLGGCTVAGFMEETKYYIMATDGWNSPLRNLDDEDDRTFILALNYKRDWYMYQSRCFRIALGL